MADTHQQHWLTNSLGLKLFRTSREGSFFERETMERRVVVICAVVGVLGLLSVILGFVAEATKIKVSQKNI